MGSVRNYGLRKRHCNGAVNPDVPGARLGATAKCGSVAPAPRLVPKSWKG